MCEILGFLSGEDVDVGLMSCNCVDLPWRWRIMFLWNVGMYLKVHMILQPRRPTSTSHSEHYRSLTLIALLCLCFVKLCLLSSLIINYYVCLQVIPVLFYMFFHLIILILDPIFCFDSVSMSKAVLHPYSVCLIQLNHSNFDVWNSSF